MIVSCAPLRVSFAGGGSGVAAFYRKRGGAVLSFGAPVALSQ
jgi:D-glycero-alpha-D-manno-heptose-7-phosphate kinase